ncbi:MAG TPA: alpha/beta hydrolase [Candidatus Limnocylindrales bacterium]|nr:alpha/beta hydrolase [Candidatus Limnocylindrales bacterium]
MKETMIEGLAGPIHVVEAGSGEGIPVLFAHAFAGSSTQWSPQLNHESETRRAVAIDFHGHGRSDASTHAPYDIASFADDIQAAADGLDLDRFVIVGHSLGGAAAIKHAADYPNRVAGLVLVATPGRMPDAQVAGVRRALDTDYTGTMAGIWKRLLANATPATRRTVEGESDKISEKVARAIIAATFEFDPVLDLESYAGPRLTISTPPDGPVQDLSALVRGVDHETVEGTSHWIQLDDPDRFNAILDAFLERVDAAETRTPAGAAKA